MGKNGATGRHAKHCYYTEVQNSRIPIEYTSAEERGVCCSSLLEKLKIIGKKGET